MYNVSILHTSVVVQQNNIDLPGETVVHVKHSLIAGSCPVDPGVGKFSICNFNSDAGHDVVS